MLHGRVAGNGDLPNLMPGNGGCAAQLIGQSPQFGANQLRHLPQCIVGVYRCIQPRDHVGAEPALRVHTAGHGQTATACEFNQGGGQGGGAQVNGECVHVGHTMSRRCAECVSTEPILRAKMPRPPAAAMNRSPSSGASAISMPPEVWGSNSGRSASSFGLVVVMDGR